MVETQNLRELATNNNYVEPLNEFRWLDKDHSQQAYLVQNGASYTGQRKGAFDVPVTFAGRNELTWVPIRKEWRDRMEEPKYF